MRIPTTLIALSLLLGSAAALADLEPWKDYDQSDAVWSITTIRVQPNMDDAYLEGLAKTWVTTNEAAKKLGQIEDYEIFRRVEISTCFSSSSLRRRMIWRPTRHVTTRS
jgi:hypothetical protein